MDDAYSSIFRSFGIVVDIFVKSGKCSKGN